jgi:unsaturated rhamnogalacturonyl hydrolase
MKKYFFYVFLFLVGDLFSQVSMAENMAKTIMTQYPDSMVVKKYINHLMQDNLLDKSKNTNDIEEANKRPANWNYEIGVVLTGFERLWESTGDPKYIKYIKHILDHFISPDGSIRTFLIEEFNSDNIPPGRQLITLYNAYKDEKYLKAINRLKYQLDIQPRLKEGGYWHKLRYPYQMWLDGVYMTQPFKSKYLTLTKKNEEWNDIANQFIWMAKGSKDAKTGLLYHGFDESRIQKWADPVTGKSPNFWSRSLGWYMLGIVDVLEMFPKDHPQRNTLINLLESLTQSLINFQDPESKVWWQVTDKANKEGNYLESSGSSMMVAAILKATRLGLLPSRFKDAGIAGYEGILKKFITKDEGGIYHLNDAVSGAGLGGTPYRDGSYEYYIKEPKRNDDLKAIGPFMQAAIEYELATKPTLGKGKTVLLDRYFNNEYKDGQRFHYTWEDEKDSGFSWMGKLFSSKGANLKNLDGEPTMANLKGSNVYIIVDPDHIKDAPKPNYINTKHIDAIKKWVSDGGSLLLMTNDTTNADVIYSNKLAQAFGISFTMKNINFVKNNNFPDGVVRPSAGNSIFDPALKLYVKELVTLKVDPQVEVVAKTGDDIIMAAAKYGKGKVFVIGDPWLYNEYVYGRILPADFDNYKAASQLIDWLLK